MNLIDFLNSPTAHALGWTLLHAVWQGFALVLPTAVILHLLRNRSGALRYRVGVLTLLAQVMTSVVTFLYYYKPGVAPNRLVLASAPVQALPLQWQMVARTIPWHQQAQQFLENHLSQFVLIYLIGVAVFGLRLAGGWLYLQRLSRTAVHPADLYLTELINRLRLALAIRPAVQVRESVRIVVPMVVGVLNPVLLLPFGLATQLSVQELEAVLAHELAHVKRHDYAVNLLQSVVEVLYFFHPALWWLSARVREEREHCCDDLAVQACGGNGRVLAQALARVEELRLAQFEPMPALAMALATNRQQLLHRVRRVLGVPTRPLVSNGSLAGLTLATILLMSISVYAVQQEPQPKPKARVNQPKSTRRHKVDSSSEYGMAGNRKVSYIIWKGQKLPASRIARLQRQLDQVMAGQLNLDDVLRADRDILLTIIEKNSSFDAGMNGLAQGLAQIDYNTIMTTAFDAANAAGTFPVNVDDVLKEVETIDYNRVIGDAMAVVDTNIIFSDNDMIKSGNENVVRRYQQRQMDSLSRLMAQRAQQMDLIRLQMEKFQFPIDELKRNQDVLNWRKDKLMEQRDALIQKHQRLLQNDGKQKLSQAETEKQLEALQPDIKKLEGSMEELNKQFEAVTAKEDEIKLPMEKLQQEAERLQEEVSKYASQMDKYGHDIDRSFRLNEDLNINLNSDLNRLELDAVRAGTRTPRAPRPPKPAHTVIEGTVVRPAAPVVPNARVVPVRPVTPRPVPKVAPAPKPDKE